MNTTLTNLSMAMLLLLAVSGCGHELASDAAADHVPETDPERALYVIAFNIGTSMRTDVKPTDAEGSAFRQGLRDALAGSESRVDRTFPAQKVLEARTAAGRNERAAELAKSASLEAPLAAAHVERAAGEAGAVRSESGVIYREVSEGDGEHPSASSMVRVHYHGTLRDGTVFDSSVDRGTPAEFPVGGVIACWQEAIPKMRVGGKAVITCPPDQAYGNRAAGAGKIPAGSALTFEVELIEIL